MSSLEAVKSKITATDSLSEPIKRDIVLKLDAAGYASELNQQWSYYMQAFQSLKSQYDLNQNQNIKALADELLNFMKVNYSSTFESMNEKKPEIFEVR